MISRDRRNPWKFINHGNNKSGTEYSHCEELLGKKSTDFF